MHVPAPVISNASIAKCHGQALSTCIAHWPSTNFLGDLHAVITLVPAGGAAGLIESGWHPSPAAGAAIIGNIARDVVGEDRHVAGDDRTVHH